MSTTLTNKFVVMFAATALFFGAAAVAFAYDNLEIEIGVEDNKTEVEVSYDEDGEEMEEKYEYNTTDLDEVYTLLAAELGMSEGMIKDAIVDEDAVDDENMDDEDADEKEDEDGKDDEDEDDDKDRAEFCEKTKQAAGYGVARKCADEDGYELNDKLKDKVEKQSDRMDKYAEYGKSSDKVELQNQLRELLTLLIQLMQQQMAMQEAGS